jgi:hypothetical protein
MLTSRAESPWKRRAVGPALHALQKTLGLDRDLGELRQKIGREYGAIGDDDFQRGDEILSGDRLDKISHRAELHGAPHQVPAVAQGESHDLRALELPPDVAHDGAGHVVDDDDEKVGRRLILAALKIEAGRSLADPEARAIQQFGDSFAEQCIVAQHGSLDNVSHCYSPLLKTRLMSRMQQRT